MANDTEAGRESVLGRDDGADPYASLHDTADPGALARAWLTTQVGMLGADVQQGVVVLGENGSFAPVAVWPEGTLGSPALVLAIEEAITKSEPVRLGSRRGNRAQRQKIDAIACPLMVDGQVAGAVGVEIEHSPVEQQKDVLAKPGWGAAWLESAVRKRKYNG